MYFDSTVIIFTLLVLLVIYGLMKWAFSPYRHIPSPFAWPIVGHTFYLVRSDPIATLSSWADKYKEYGLFKLNVLNVNAPTTIMVTKPEYQKDMLSKSTKYIRDEKSLRYFFPLLGSGLLASHGEDHRVQKKLLAKAFSFNHLKYYIPAFDKHTLVLVKIWQDLLTDSSCGEKLNVKYYFNNLSFDIIGEIGFGYQFNSQTTVTNDFVKSYRELTEGFMNVKARILLKYLPFLKYMPFGPAKVLKDTNDAAAAVLDMVLETRRNKTAAGNLTTLEQNDLLNMLITEKDEKTGRGFSDQLIKDNCYTFFLAGHETTATSLPGILMYLAKFPDYQERCRKEVEKVCSCKEILTLEDLSKLQYTSAFIKEAMRLFSTVPQMGRICTEDVTLGQFHFPKGTRFICFVAGSNRSDESFDDPNAFIPERYLEINESKVGTAFTFGYGSYSCIGKNLALQQIKVTIARLLLYFKFTIDPDNETFIRQMKLTVVYKPPIMIGVQSL